jgi:hypothetical protein
MNPHPSRRDFLTACSGLLLLALPVTKRRDHCAAGSKPVPGPGDHPEPRPGITAANVLADDKLGDFPDAKPAFTEVREIPQIVDGIRCHCGCATREGFYSLLSCYEGEGMAMMCHICQGQARLAYRLHQSGKSLDDIRKAVDARYH